MNRTLFILLYSIILAIIRKLFELNIYTFALGYVLGAIFVIGIIILDKER